MDKLLDDITSLNFDSYGLCVLNHLIPKIFQDTLQQFRFVKKVPVCLSRNYPKPSSFLDQDVTTVHAHLTHLEITAGNALCIEQDMLHLASGAFSTLKYLSLWFNCGWYNKKEKEFIVDMAETQLERLNLDVTPIRVQTGRILKRAIEVGKMLFYS